MTDLHGNDRKSNDELLDIVSARADRGQRYFKVVDGYRKRGYVLLSVPLPDSYDGFCEEAEKALDRLDERADDIRQAFRFRGWSKPLIERLQEVEPQPYFGARARKF